jgi:hypothetical protein
VLTKGVSYGKTIVTKGFNMNYIDMYDEFMEGTENFINVIGCVTGDNFNEPEIFEIEDIQIDNPVIVVLESQEVCKSGPFELSFTHESYDFKLQGYATLKSVESGVAFYDVELDY